jgi:hypothetical protein
MTDEDLAVRLGGGTPHTFTAAELRQALKELLQEEAGSGTEEAGLETELDQRPAVPLVRFSFSESPRR